MNGNGQLLGTWAQIGTLVFMISSTILGASFWVISQLHDIADEAREVNATQERKIAILENEEEQAATDRLRLSQLIDQATNTIQDLSGTLRAQQQFLLDLKHNEDHPR